MVVKHQYKPHTRKMRRGLGASDWQQEKLSPEKLSKFQAALDDIQRTLHAAIIQDVLKELLMKSKL